MATIAIQTGSTTVDPYAMVDDFNAPAQNAKKAIAQGAKTKIKSKRVKEQMATQKSWGNCRQCENQ